MKKINYLFLAVVTSAALLTSCMDRGYDDVTATTQTAFGNDTITERNVYTIKELCELTPYRAAMKETRSAKLVTEDIQLKLRVAGNDIGGNIYNKVALQDSTGNAIIACVYTGGMFAYLPVGQEILINLKGLYIGCYGKQRQIGVPYTTSSGNTYAGRMPGYMWQQHIKLVGTPDPGHKSIKPIKFTQQIYDNIDEYAGRLMYMENVNLIDANGTNTWAPATNSIQEDEENTDFSISRFTLEWPMELSIYTSTSAKFANEIIPYDIVNKKRIPLTITGIFSRYGTSWQVMMRDKNDYKVYNAN